jgi:hypothetical protein
MSSRFLFQRFRQIGLLSRKTARSTNFRNAIAFHGRAFSDSANNGSSKGSAGSTTGVEWRKAQLDKLERKFADPKVLVDNEEDLQPMWKQMEGRVTRRRPLTVDEMGGKTGRINVRKTDEEMWLQEGLYDEKEPKA